MNLLQVIQDIMQTAMRQPAVNMIVKNDIYRINEPGDYKYGAFCYTQKAHQSSAQDDFNTFRFTLFYVDRLIEEHTNEEEIQSTGIEVLNNVLRTLDEQGIEVGEGYQLQPFTQKFNDNCAGVFADVSLRVLKNGTCTTGYPDFNEDFNNDFLII